MMKRMEVVASSEVDVQRLYYECRPKHVKRINIELYFRMGSRILPIVQ